MSEENTSMKIPDLIITIAYFSIPIQILASLYHYPSLAKMPLKVTVLLILFAFFIFLCGAGHFLKCLNKVDSELFHWVNALTAVISLMTAFYLLPLIPDIMSQIDQSLKEATNLNKEILESKANLVSFMAFLCHEIRNPLFAVTSAAQFLQDTAMTEEQAVGVGSIFDSALLMLRLVNDVLDLSKLDTGKLELEVCPFNLRSLLQKLEATMRLQVEQEHGNEVQFDFCIDSNVPTVIYGDSTRFLQIVYNLISNANKFTATGTIQLTVSVDEKIHSTERATTMNPNSISDEEARLLSEAEEGVAVRKRNDCVNLVITVCDTGTGIDPARVKDIFKPYSQAKLSDYRNHGGTGLGLAIIASLLKLMNGNISVNTRVDVGSTFTVTIPVILGHSNDKRVEELPTQLNIGEVVASTKRLPILSNTIDMDHLANKSDSRELPEGTSFGSLDGGTLIIPDISNTPPKLSQVHDDVSDDNSVDKLELLIQQPDIERNPDVSIALSKFDFPENENIILVVDDNNINRKILGRMLKYYNLDHRFAVNGHDAVQKLRQSKNMSGNSNAPHFGLVLMDLSMPVMDGFHAIHELRKLGLKIPIIALTANALSQEKERALAAGATEFKTKPIMRDDLHAVCKLYLR